MDSKLLESNKQEDKSSTQPEINDETLIISNFISFFEPLVQNLDSSVVSLRYLKFSINLFIHIEKILSFINRLSQCELTAQIKQILSGMVLYNYLINSTLQPISSQEFIKEKNLFQQN
jgi:hypothetical protein